MEIEGLSEEYGVYVNYGEENWNGHSVQQLDATAAIGIVPTAVSDTGENKDSSDDSDSSADNSESNVSGEVSLRGGMSTDGSKHASVGVEVGNDRFSGSIHGGVNQDPSGKVNGDVEVTGKLKF